MNGKRLFLVSVGLFCCFYILSRFLLWNYVQIRMNIASKTTSGNVHTEHGASKTSEGKVHTEHKVRKLVISNAIAVTTEDPLSQRSFDAWFQKWSPIMSELTKTQVEAGSKIEGHIWTQDNLGFERVPQIRAYYDHVLARRSKIHRICETGFNGGHSTLMWASLFNGDISIIVFDLCNENRCDVGAQFIRKYFPYVNLIVMPGDSTVNIQNYAKANPEEKCDFFSVDGGHFGDVPRLDIYNFLSMATDSSTVVLDDVNSDSDINYLQIVGQAWARAVAQKWVTPLGPCQYCFREQLQTVYNHKFCLAKYNRSLH